MTNPHLEHEQQLRADFEALGPHMEEMYKRAASMVFPSTPQLWKLSSGPWSAIVMQVMVWMEREVDCNDQAYEVLQFQERIRAYWDSISADAKANTSYQLSGDNKQRAAATRKLIDELDLEL
jgi:hypothetical protein